MYNEINFNGKYEVILENEYKVLIRSLIIGIILLNSNSEVMIGIDEKILKIIKESREYLSTRWRLDNEYYMELLVIEKFLSQMDIRMVSCSAKEVKNIKICRDEMKKILLQMKEYKNETYRIDVNVEGLVTDEFNLYWKHNLVLGDLRGWRKKVSEGIWKNEILNSKKIEDLFYYNYRNEFDWVKSLKFISNRNKFSFWQCADEDTKERAYKIKNWIKELPTYSVLFKRNVEGIKNNICPRCNKEEEDWYHLWKCDEISVREIILASVCDFETKLETKIEQKI